MVATVMMSVSMSKVNLYSVFSQQTSDVLNTLVLQK